MGLAALLGWWLIRDAQHSRFRERTTRPGTGRTLVVDTPNASTKNSARRPTKSRLSLEEILLGIPNERLVRFGSEEAYRRFLSKLDGSGVHLLGKIDQLRAVRLGVQDLADLDELLGEEDDDAANYYVSIPTDDPGPGIQSGALGFGDQLLAWLGVTGDNSTWGEGIKIAVLDTGINPHAALPDGLLQIDLVSGDQEIPTNGHGTSVASLIVGQGGLTQGVAPAAELFSVRIGDENGASNSFLLAEGIIAAVDQGAQLINISMGSEGNSAIVREAVNYAVAQGVLLIASSGNSGFNSPSYPAAYDEVIAVGSVDAKSDYLNFSNLGSSLDAPGYGLYAAGEEGSVISFSGTSASAPIVTAAIAAVSSELDVPLTQAYEIVNASLNEAGAPGLDPAYGDGILNLGRAIESETPGIYDAAAASNHYVEATNLTPVPILQVTFENRGTERIINAPASVTVPNGTFNYNIGNLGPGETRTFEVPLYIPSTAESFEVSSSVDLSDYQTDRNPQNDTLHTQILLKPPEPDPSSQ